MSKLEDTAAFAIEKVLSGLEGTVTKLNELTAQHGEAAVELALGVARVQAAGELVKGAVALAMMVVWWFLWMKFFRKCGGIKMDTDSATHFLFVVTGIVGAFFSIIMLWFGFEKFLGIWNWVGIFEPKLYIAKMALMAIAK